MRTDVGLVQHHNATGLHAPAVRGRLGGYAETEGHIDMENSTTPVLLGVLSVILPSPDLSTWLPYSSDISAEGFTHTCNTTPSEPANAAAGADMSSTNNSHISVQCWFSALSGKMKSLPPQKCQGVESLRHWALYNSLFLSLKHEQA